MEQIFSNLSTAFTTTKIIEETPVKCRRSRNKDATSSDSNKGDLKMISIHPNFIEAIRDPFCKNKFFNLMPRSVVTENLYAKSVENLECPIKELEDKDDKT